MMIYLLPNLRLNIWPHSFGIGCMLSFGPFLFQVSLGWFAIALEGLTDPCTCSSCIMDREVERRLNEAKQQSMGDKA